MAVRYVWVALALALHAESKGVVRSDLRVGCFPHARPTLLPPTQPPTTYVRR